MHKYIIATVVSILCLGIVFHYGETQAEKNPWVQKKREKGKQKKGEACTPATGKTDLDVNNVRARIMTGGDMWWDLQSVSEYEVPKGSKKTAMFSASLWIGGTDVNGQLKCAALRFRSQGNDYWPGPLTKDGTASVEASTCKEFDKHFVITRAEVDAHISWARDPDKYPSYTIPRSIREWPAHGDITKGQSYYLAPFFDTDGDGAYQPEQGDYPYYDVDGSLCPNNLTSISQVQKTREGNGILSDQVLKGDKTLWWVFNDKGNVHTETGGDAIGMEIRAQAFGFATNDEINNMTFYSYELINRSTFKLTDTYFSQWVDTDLGYSYDDYVGCDVMRGLGYCYNGKAVDGTGREDHYGDQPPAIGVDFFQGPYMDPDGRDNPRFTGDCSLLDSEFELDQMAINGVNFGDGIIDNERFGMRRFVYHNNNQTDQGDPQIAIEYYNYLRGIWRDGSKMVFGGNAHIADGQADGPECDFMFPGDTDPCNWGTQGEPTKFPVNGQYWTEEQAGNQPYDRRFMQSAGPFSLEPGAVNYITVGIPWARATSGGPFASVELLKQVDDKAQRLFENCFQIVEGPDAPDLVVQELDKELILYISNRKNNPNAKENYSVFDPRIISPDTLPYLRPDGTQVPRFDSLYRFEGYQIFQVKDRNVSIADIHDNDLARLVAQCDIKNGVSKLVNYYHSDYIGGNVPVVEVDGTDKGIVHSFRIKEDKFASGDKALVNHKPYYYITIAYAYNQFMRYSQEPGEQDPGVSGIEGQREPYLASRKNQAGGVIVPVEGIPHKTEPEKSGTRIKAAYGEGPAITRVEGHGNGGLILDLTEESVKKILQDGIAETPTYEKSKGPVNVKVVDPLNVVKGNFTLKFIARTDTVIPAGADTTILLSSKPVHTSKIVVEELGWELAHEETGEVATSDQSIEKLYQYYDGAAFHYYDTILKPNEQLLPQYGLAIFIEQRHASNLYPTMLSGVGCAYMSGDEQAQINNIVQVDFLGATLEYKDSTNRWLDGLNDNDASEAINWIRSGTLSDENDAELNDYHVEIYLDDDCDTSGTYAKFFLDPQEQFENVLDGQWAPFPLCSRFKHGPMIKGLPWIRAIGQSQALENYFNKYFDYTLGQSITMANTYSIDLVLTPDQDKWTRSPVLEMCEDNVLSDGNRYKFDLRAGSSIDKDGNTGSSAATYDGAASGMGWFPGYAINVETGERLNIMYGEDSWLVGENGRDMKFNPTSDISSINNMLFGGKHYVYVMGHNDPDGCPAYDEGKYLYGLLSKLYNDRPAINNPTALSNALVDEVMVFKDVMWVGIPLAMKGKQWLSNEVKIRIRVARPYVRYYTASGAGATAALNQNYPMYSFSTDGLETVTQVVDSARSALDLINVVPNPYYAYSGYEGSQLDNRVRITNLPEQCVLTIYTVNGVLVRKLTKADATTAIDWDLKNHAGIPISGGLYIIHVKAEGIGERILKWFGTLRPVDLNSF